MYRAHNAQWQSPRHQLHRAIIACEQPARKPPSGLGDLEGKVQPPLLGATEASQTGREKHLGSSKVSLSEKYSWEWEQANQLRVRGNSRRR